MSNKFLDIANDWGYEVEKLSDHEKYNGESGDVYTVEYTKEGSSRTVTIGRCGSEEDAVDVIKKHAAVNEKGLLRNVSENMSYPSTSSLHKSNDAFYTFGNSQKTRDFVMNLLNTRFGEVTKSTDQHGRTIFKNKDGITVGLSEIDGEGDRTWNVFRSDTVKVKENFSVMREMTKLIPRGKLPESFSKPAKKPMMTHSSDCSYNYGHDCDCDMVKTHASDCSHNYGHDCDCGLDAEKKKSKSPMREAVRRVPAGTFTQTKMSQPDKNPGDDGYDWRNPNHNPSGVKPAATKPHKVKGKYNPDNYPVLDAEHGTHLFDPDLVDHLKTIYNDWDKMDELDQIKLQYSFVEPMPRTGYDYDEAEKRLRVKAIRAQKQIKL